MTSNSGDSFSVFVCLGFDVRNICNPHQMTFPWVCPGSHGLFSSLVYNMVNYSVWSLMLNQFGIPGKATPATKCCPLWLVNTNYYICSGETLVYGFLFCSVF